MLTLEEVKNNILESGSKLGLDNDSNLYPLFTKSSQAFSEGTTIYIYIYQIRNIILLQWIKVK